MRSANDTRLETWRRVRSYAVPRSMIESCSLRRAAGDWPGACAAARFDVDLDLRAAGSLASTIRDDLRNLAPDLLRWHLPRSGPDGLLRPGLTVTLARYDRVHLVVRTPPAWADGGQRVSLALWQRGDPGPRPDRRFRLDLHRHLWDARRAGELWDRVRPDLWDHSDLATHRWAGEAAILLAADGLPDSPVAVRLGSGRRMRVSADGTVRGGARAADPVLPDAATRMPPDLLLLDAGRISGSELHPLVAEALVPGCRPSAPVASPGYGPRLVDCDGAQHRIGLVDGVLAPLDHDPAELRREQLLVSLGGTPLPCLRAVDAVIRHPADLPDVRARLDHGDYAGALDTVEALLGPDVLLRDGALRDELRAAADQQVVHGLFRAGMTGHCPPRCPTETQRRRTVRSRPRLARAH